MPIPYVASSSRSEIREHLSFVGRVLSDHADLDGFRQSREAVEFTSAVKKIEAIKDGYDEAFRLAVVGEFNAGKSALINALLGRPNLLPEGYTPTTGAITEIGWAETERGVVLDDTGAEIFNGELADAVKRADQRPGKGLPMKPGGRVKLGVQSELLRKLIILDTPGLGASERDDEVTRSCLFMADAAILVLNGVQPGGQDSLRLSSELRNRGRKVIVCVTRMDKETVRSGDAIGQAREFFGGISVGDPIGVSSPAILSAMVALERAEGAGDKEAISRETANLQAAGYFDLRERLQEGCFTLSSASDRARRVLLDLNAMLHELRGSAAEEVRRAEQKAAAIHVTVQAPG